MISSYFHDSSSMSSKSFPLNTFSANGMKAEKRGKQNISVTKRKLTNLAMDATSLLSEVPASL